MKRMGKSLLQSWYVKSKGFYWAFGFFIWCFLFLLILLVVPAEQPPNIRVEMKRIFDLMVWPGIIISIAVPVVVCILGKKFIVQAKRNHICLALDRFDNISEFDLVFLWKKKGFIYKQVPLCFSERQMTSIKLRIRNDFMVIAWAEILIRQKKLEYTQKDIEGFYRVFSQIDFMGYLDNRLGEIMLENRDEIKSLKSSLIKVSIEDLDDMGELISQVLSNNPFAEFCDIGVSIKEISIESFESVV